MTVKHEIRKLALKLGYEVRRYNAAESVEARLFRQISSNQVDAILDIGANDGGYGRFLRQGGYQGPIMSFEPLAEAHLALSDHARSDTFWHVAPKMALGENEAELEINVAGNSTSSSLLPMHDQHVEAAPQSRYINVQKVQVRRLDSVDLTPLGRAERILLKVDTQGYEMPVLLGATALLPRVVGVQIEMSCVALYEGQSLYMDLINWLAARGYKLWGVMPGFVDQASGRMLQFDGVFFRDAV